MRQDDESGGDGNGELPGGRDKTWTCTSEEIDLWRLRGAAFEVVVADGMQVDPSELRRRNLSAVVQAVGLCHMANRDVWTSPGKDPRPASREGPVFAQLIQPWSHELGGLLRAIGESVANVEPTSVMDSHARKCDLWSVEVTARLHRESPLEWTGFSIKWVPKGFRSAFRKRASDKCFRSIKDPNGMSSARLYCLADVVMWWRQEKHCEEWARNTMQAWENGGREGLAKQFVPFALPRLLSDLGRALRLVID
jgi:hypothetical protein